MVMINLPLNLFLCESPIDYSDSMEEIYQKKVSLYRNRTFMFLLVTRLHMKYLDVFYV